jgi:hypothetical protein
LIPILLFPLAAAAQTNKSVFVSVQAKQDKAANQKYGADEPGAIESVLETMLAKALAAKFPCAKSLDRSAVRTMLTVTRQRALFGNDDDSALAKIGAALGAKYLIDVTVQGVGDQLDINGVVLDDSSGAALSRLTVVSGGGTAAYGPIQQFATNLVNGISGGPQCSGYWKGTVGVTYVMKWNDERNGSSEEGNANLTCQVLGHGQDAKCSYQSSDTLKGKNGSLVTTKSAQNASTWVSVSVTGSKLALTFGAIPVKVTVEASVPIEPSTESYDGGSYELPASSDPKRQSGTWTDPNAPGSKARSVVTWDLSIQ